MMDVCVYVCAPCEKPLFNISICILFDSNNPTFMNMYKRILVMYEWTTLGLFLNGENLEIIYLTNTKRVNAIASIQGLK